MNYWGLAYTLGKGVSETGHFFVLLSPFFGWVAVMLSGSDASGNALFGNLQFVAVRQLNLDPVLFAAAKMISPQNIATGVSVTKLAGHEGEVVLPHLQTQHHSDACARRFGRSPAISCALDDPEVSHARQ